MQRNFQPPEICPVCGEDVPRSAKACPECGADERSGWKENALVYDALDLPDGNFDGDELGADDSRRRRQPPVKQWFWWFVAVLLLLALVLLVVR